MVSIAKVKTQEWFTVLVTGLVTDGAKYSVYTLKATQSTPTPHHLFHTPVMLSRHIQGKTYSPTNACDYHLDTVPVVSLDWTCIHD